MNHRPFYQGAEVATLEATVTPTLEAAGPQVLELLTLRLNLAFEKLSGIRYMVMEMRPIPGFVMQ